MSETYMFMSAPAAVEGDRRKKYREQAELEEELGRTSNMMFDPRVHRGATCVRPDNLERMMKLKEEPERPKRPRQSKASLIRQGRIRPIVPSVSELHEKIQVTKERVEVPLHLYLIEQETPILTNNEGAQTDTFLKEPPTPDYIPVKSGVDMETQIENEAVFNFDRDVSTILAVVISKTLEQSLLEVQQEEEFRWMKSEKSRLEDKEMARQKDAQELEQQERARLIEKAKIVRKDQQRAEQEKQLQDLLAANVFARYYLQGLQESCFQDLTRLNMFYDPVEKEAEALIPWLKEEIMKNLSGIGGNRSGLEEKRGWVDVLLQNALDTIHKEAHQAYSNRAQAKKLQDNQKAAKEREIQENLFRNRKLKLKIGSKFLESMGIILPTINIQANETIEATLAKVTEWMDANMPESMLEKLELFHNEKFLDNSRFLWELGEDLSGLSLRVPSKEILSDLAQDAENDEADEEVE